MSMEYWLNDSDEEKAEVCEGKPVPEPVSTTKPIQMCWGLNLDLCSKSLATNHLRDGTASLCE
jgi:hypothetical protein